MRDTFKLVLPSDLSPKNKVEFLESIMLLKEKRDRKTKGRNCTDEKKKIIHKQRIIINTNRIIIISVYHICDKCTRREICGDGQHTQHFYPN